MINKNICPDIETIACYIDGILPQNDRELLEQHIGICKKCKEEISCQVSVAELQKKEGLALVPDYLTEKAKSLVSEKFGTNVLAVVAKFTDKTIELVRTTGDVFFGGKLQPVYVMRGKDAELTTSQSVFKIFDDVRVEIEISRQKADLNKFILKVKDNKTELAIDNLRATLIKDDIELESYITKNGRAIFENINPGKYLLCISKVTATLGVINLEINKE